MKVYAVYEDSKLMALCLEPVAIGALQGELYYGFGDSEIDVREVEIDENVWRSFEEKRQSFPQPW